MPQAEFEPTIPVSERPQTHALDRAATGIGHVRICSWIIRKLQAHYLITLRIKFKNCERIQSVKDTGRQTGVILFHSNMFLNFTASPPYVHT